MDTIYNKTRCLRVNLNSVRLSREGKRVIKKKKKWLLKPAIKEHKRRTLTEIKRFRGILSFLSARRDREFNKEISCSHVLAAAVAAMCWPYVGRTAIT